MKAATEWPDEETMIPELLQAAPQTRTVLDRYGLRRCGAVWDRWSRSDTLHGHTKSRWSRCWHIACLPTEVRS